MDYEKKYKDILAKAREIHRNEAEKRSDMEWLFPELKNKDERIRKALVRFHKSTIDIDGIKGADILAWLEKQGKQKPVDKVEPFDKYKGLTDFERTLADICIGWIGEELGWKQYIKDNADVLLKIAIKKFNSIQDAPFEQKSAAWSDEDEKMYKIAFSCIETLEDISNGKNMHADVKDWLKSIKDRIGG